MSKYDNLKLESQLCFPLYACSKEIIRTYKPFLDKVDLTYTQYITLLVLWENDNINIKSLGEKLLLDSGTLTPVIKKLETKALITKVRNTMDERNIIISLTKKGKELKNKVNNIPKEVGKCIDLKDEEAILLYQTLYKILNNIKK